MIRCLLGRLRSELGFYKELEKHCPDVAQYVPVINFSISVLHFETLSVYCYCDTLIIFSFSLSLAVFLCLLFNFHVSFSFSGILLSLLSVICWCQITGCPLQLEMLEMLEKLENDPLFRIWLEKLENHRFFSCFDWKSWNFIFRPYNN